MHLHLLMSAEPGIIHLPQLAWREEKQEAPQTKARVSG